MIKIINKEGYKLKYRYNTPDEIAVKTCSFYSDKSVDPFYEFKVDSNVIMIGGYIGFFTIYAASKSPKGKVYSIEPDSENFKLLRDNIELNGVENVVIDQIAIGGDNGNAKLYLDDNYVGHSTTKYSENFKYVKMFKLDSYFNYRNIKKCDLLKINCEGAEYEIILNAGESVFKKISNINISYHNHKVKKFTEADIVNKLKKVGYRVFLIKRNKDRGWIIAYKEFTLQKRFFIWRFRIIRFKNRIRQFIKYKILRNS